MLVWWPSVIPVISFYITPCWYGVNQSDPTNGVRRSSDSLIVTCTDVAAVRILHRTDDRTNGVRQQLVESGGHLIV